MLLASGAQAQTTVATRPQDITRTIKQRCAAIFTVNYEMRLFCEYSEYMALNSLLFNQRRFDQVARGGGR
jgi:hypothetical protein